MTKSTVSNWGNYPSIDAKTKSFTSVSELDQDQLPEASYIARGNGRCYGDSSLQSHIISTLKYDKILEFDAKEGIIKCQSGITFSTLIDFLIPRGLFLPVTPGTKFITVGGAIASDIHGKNHHVEGSFQNHIIHIEVLLASGDIIECSREKESDLFMATCGGMGLTGIILSAKFRLKKIETALIKQVSIKARNLDHIFDLFEEFKSTTYSVAWIDCLQGGDKLGRSLLMVGEHATKQELGSDESLRNPNGKLKLSIPFNFPNIVLNKITIKIFNFLFYHKQIAARKESYVNFDKFFYPLDFINSWNRMYGNRGFVQYQFVLPIENSKEGLRKILSEINNQGMGSFLAVLKLFGNYEGLISFPMQGYTLALDFPIRKGLFEFLDRLDQIVVDCGGRIYLTKDARMDKKVFEKGYPNLERFKNIVKKFNPDLKWRSVQSDRLAITKP
ncbi:MAG: FAD-linked oxidase [Flavobacterium psychrophilum]|nr:MAG: FAD-linked oxidase [Flavobacterium psychrophilum]